MRHSLGFPRRRSRDTHDLRHPPEGRNREDGNQRRKESVNDRLRERGRRLVVVEEEEEGKHFPPKQTCIIYPFKDLLNACVLHHFSHSFHFGRVLKLITSLRFYIWYAKLRRSLPNSLFFHCAEPGVGPVLLVTDLGQWQTAG